MPAWCSEDSKRAGNHWAVPKSTRLLLAIFGVDDPGSSAVATLPCLAPGVRIRTVMKCGCAFAQASASRLVSKNRSMTMALRSAAFRPHERAALRLTTSGPLSTATHAASGKTTLLAKGIFFGSTAQFPCRSRAPFQDACSPEPSRCQ